MNKEKLIKCQALNSLKGSWIILIAMALIISAAMLAIIGMGTIAQLATKSLDISTNMAKSGMEFQFALINGLTFTVMFFLSPLINGFFKSAYIVAHNEIPLIWDIFSFFKSARLYFKTILLNLIFFIVLSAAAFAFDFNYLKNIISDSFASNEIMAVILKPILNVSFGAVTVFLISFVYLFFVNYAMFLFVDNPNCGVFHCFGTGIKMFVKNFGNTMKLYFSFIGWIALCFFVVTAFYVLPYITTTFATSAKWLISIEKGRNQL